MRDKGEGPEGHRPPAQPPAVRPSALQRVSSPPRRGPAVSFRTHGRAGTSGSWRLRVRAFERSIWGVAGRWFGRAGPDRRVGRLQASRCCSASPDA